MKTEITKLLGIEYPIIQGGMAWVAEYHLAGRSIKCRRTGADWGGQRPGAVGERADSGGKETNG